MALIKCTECGHEVSDKASECSHCGCPIEKRNCCVECGQPIPEGVNVCTNCGCPMQGNLAHDFGLPQKSKSSLIWLVPILALSVLLGGGYYFFNKANGTEREEVNEIRINSHLADGHYTFKGNWESSRYSAQPCKLEFEKNGMNLESCAYTNLKYDTRIPLTGTIKNDTLHFVGDISGKQLVITLKIASNGDMLIGEGIDYAHSGDKAKLNLTKNVTDNKGKQTKETSNQEVEGNERIMKEGPDWLQGAWKLELTDDHGSHLGYMYEVFNHGTSKSYINEKYLFERHYTVSGDIIIYEKGHYQLDNTRQIVLGANGKEMQKISNDPYYTPNSSSSQSSSNSYSNNSSTSSKGYRFSSPQDVIGWLADKSFFNGSRRLRIRPNGVWLNDYCATGAPNVERWESWKALIRAYTATGERLSFFVDPINGTVTDEASDVFRLR